MAHSTSGLLPISYRPQLRSAPSSPHRRPGYSSYTVVKRSRSRSRSRSSSRGRSFHHGEITKVVESERIVRRSRSRSPPLPRNRSRTPPQAIIVRRSRSRSPPPRGDHSTITSKSITVVKRERSLSASPPAIYVSRGRSHSPKRRAQYESDSHSHIRKVYTNSRRRSPSLSVRNTNIIVYRTSQGYYKVSRKYISTTSLRFFGLEWEYDPVDPNMIIILHDTNKYDIHALLQHTRVVRRGRSAPHYRRDSPEGSHTIVKRKVYYVD